MKKKAFSLIELLISLITISVILASLAPMVTHKLKHGGISIAQGESVTNTCTSFGANCQLCTKKKCLLCLVTCPDGQYADKDTCSCKNCITNCGSCINAISCNRCKAGYQKSGNSCSACGSGYYSTEGGSCTKCPKGTRANSGSAATGCVNCDGSDQFQDEEGKTTCKTCFGFVHNGHKSCSSCIPGSYWNGSSCQSCAAGTYSSGINSTSCSNCGAGTYQPSAGQTSCISCSGANQYQDSTGQTTCKTCGANSVPNSSHTACTSTCQTTANCGANQYLKDSCTCTDCPSGQSPNSTKTGCTVNVADCSADGKYYIAATNSCGDCAAGCKKCTGASSCTECYNTTGDDPEYLLDSGTCKKYKKPNSQEDCNRLTGTTTIYVPDDYNNPTTGGFCMKKRNAGDNGGPSVDYTGTIELHKAGDSKDTCSSTAGTKCCWYGYSGKYQGRTEVRTAADSKCSTTPGNIPVISSAGKFDYEGCKRTVCNWYAADHICRNIDATNKKLLWNLPTQANLTSLKNAIDAGPASKTDTSAKISIQKFSGSNGLQLCQYDTAQNTAGSPRCDSPSSLRCYGATSAACTPGWITGRAWSEDYIYVFMATGNWFGSHDRYGKNGAYSVRCVLHKYVD